MTFGVYFGILKQKQALCEEQRWKDNETDSIIIIHRYFTIEKVDLHSLNKKKKKQRKKRTIYFVPPFDRRVKTKIGKQFLQILDKTIPKGHRLHSVLNRHTVKIGYTNMPNLMRKVSNHNSKVAREARMEENITNNQVPIQEQELPCNCDPVRLGEECPLDGRRSLLCKGN